MSASWFFEENFNGLSDDFFDDVISNLDFPLEDVEPSNGGEDWNVGFQSLEAPPMDMLLGACKGDAGVKASLQHSQLSSSEASSNSKSSINNRVSRFFQSSSPVSVLGSNNAFSPDKKPISLAPAFISMVKGRRSKRKRPSTLNAFLFPLPEKFQPSISSASEANSNPSEKPIKRKWKKQKSLGFGQEASLRKCTHCETTKTPQWREGPKGPKTLCNACGVRYRSGRLLPEYRPASSPTFSPSLHSNSHRKIVEMRKTTMINA